jgi:hypothetical protein
MKQHTKERGLDHKSEPICKTTQKRKTKNRVLVIQEAKPHLGTLEEFLSIRYHTTNHNLPLNYTM